MRGGRRSGEVLLTVASPLAPWPVRGKDFLLTGAPRVRRWLQGQGALGTNCPCGLFSNRTAPCFDGVSSHGDFYGITEKDS